MKILILFSVLLIHVASVFSIYLKSVELGETKLEPLENIYSNHLPQFIEPLNLTTGELKLFAGHSFQLIKAKCPAVSEERLALIAKYIAKLISRNNPQPGSSPAFKDLVNSISTCSAHQITDDERNKREQSFFRFFFHPLRGLRNLFGYPSMSMGESEDSSIVVASSTVAPPDTLPLDAESETIQVINLKDNDRLSSFGKEDDDSEDFAIPSSTVRPDALSDSSSLDSAEAPLIRIFYTTSVNPENNDDGPLSPWNPLGWIGGIFRVIRNIFSGMFGTPDTDEVSASSSPLPLSAPTVIRVRRDILEPIPYNYAQKEATDPSEKIDLRDAEFFENTPTIAAPLKGREAFLSLIDNICRIYCKECLGQDQIRSFKAASKELFQFILTDTTGIELASKHFLEPDFLQSLNECAGVNL